MNIVLLYSLVISFMLLPPSVKPACDVVPITEWGGSPTNFEKYLPRPVKLVVVTHTVTGACDTDQECERIANAIRHRHMRDGLPDIGLSFLVGDNGKIYEGAGWKVGSHTPGYNDIAISLSFIGDFRERLPSEQALKAAEHFLGCALTIWHLDCYYILVGHRQLMSTASPGNALQEVIQTWPRWSQNVPLSLY